MRLARALLLALATATTIGLAAPGCGGSSGGRGGAGGAGASARDFLDDATYDTLEVEVDHVAGQAPSASALALLETRLEERCVKPGGVTIIVDDQVPSAGTTYSVADNQALERQHRDRFSSAATRTAVMYLLYLDGASDQDSGSSRVLGWAHGPSSVGIFRESVAASANALATAAEVEAAVLVHEAGHLLGLVNGGTPMVLDHEDPAHRGHDADDACIMFWQIETSDIGALILNLGAVPTQFDARCVDDLRASGGR